jgi:transposase
MAAEKDSKKKALSIIRKVNDFKRRTVNDILHKISKHIIDEAVTGQACIVLGDLKGIRQRISGKRMDRIVAKHALLQPLDIYLIQGYKG